MSNALKAFLFAITMGGPALAAGPTCNDVFLTPPHRLVQQLLVLRAEIELQPDRNLARLLYREYQSAYSEARDLGLDLSRLKEVGGAKQKILDERELLRQEKLKEAIDLNAWVPSSQQVGEGFYQGIVALADGKSLALINSEGRFEIRSDQGKPLATKFEVGPPGRYRMRMSGNEKVVAVTDVDEVTSLFDLSTGIKLSSFKGKEPELNYEGTLVATHRYGQLEVRQVADALNVTIFKDKFRTIPQSYQYSRDSKYLHAVVPGENLFLSFNLAAKRTQKKTVGSARGFVMHASTNQLALSVYNQAPALFDLKTKSVTGVLEAAASNMVSIAFSPNGQTIAGTNSSGNIYFWSTKSKALIHTLKLPVPNAKFAFSADGSRLIVTEAILTSEPRVWFYKVASEAE